MKKKLLQLAVGLAISLVFIWFALKGTDLKEIPKAMASAHWGWATLTVVVTLLSFWWRTWRWKIFVDPVEEISPKRLFGPLMIGFAFNNILPARAGEFIRPLALVKVGEKIRYPAALASIAVERIADVIILILLLVVTPLIIILDPTVSMNIAGIDISAEWIDKQLPKFSIIATIMLCGSLSFLIPPVKQFYFGILRALPLIPAGIKLKLEGIVNSFADGFSSLRSPKAIALTFFHSLVIWLLIAWSYQIMSWGFPGVELSFAQALAFTVVTCVVISVPAAPGFWGVFEAGGVLALLMLGVVKETESATAFAFTLMCHLLQWVPTTAIGLFAAAKLHVTSADLEKAEAAKAEVEARAAASAAAAQNDSAPAASAAGH